tara:strand:- start:13715 stop:13999 length:285 start_codon:yes stop_codon:yes gene_type:complete
VFEIVKPCQSCKSYILKPKKDTIINFKKIVKEIEKHAFEIIAYTGSMLSLKKECRINIYNSGKIAIITKDLNQVHKIASEIENILRDKKNKVVP